MKKIILILLLTLSAYAFEAGVYECKFPQYQLYIQYHLQTNGIAITSASLIKNREPLDSKEMGYWQDHGSYAIVIKNNTIIEKVGDKYIMPPENFVCEKIK